MAYRRRARLMKRRPRRTIRRRSRMMKKRVLNIHHFKRTLIGTPISTAVTTTFGSTFFRLNSLVDSSEFTNLFDQYRINKIVWKLVPNANNADAGATQRLPQVHSVIDHDDVTAPTTLDQLVQYSNYRMTMGSRVHTRVFTPSSIDDSFQSAGTSYPATISYKKWLSSTYDAITHLGIKYAIGSTATAGSITYTPYITYYLSCKDVK